ncbi:hypothetical protein AGR4A_pAt30112 [Agrobacterium tumefaciens str. B6]|uniref:Uncharacterized protein n=1 Tax=Agrobacterium tumefaciens str. B6 TaxID=1183423 RepID=A0A822VCS2_AGRTU|nr:hypothetical protein AGR4A_pAt30112 [Agrobacterium tumefaciens str. B6]
MLILSARRGKHHKIELSLIMSIDQIRGEALFDID